MNQSPCHILSGESYPQFLCTTYTFYSLKYNFFLSSAYVEFPGNGLRILSSSVLATSVIKQKPRPYKLLGEVFLEQKVGFSVLFLFMLARPLIQKSDKTC